MKQPQIWRQSKYEDDLKYEDEINYDNDNKCEDKLKYDQKYIECIQNIAFKIILGPPYETYSQSCIYMETEPLEQRRVKICLKFSKTWTVKIVFLKYLRKVLTQDIVLILSVSISADHQAIERAAYHTWQIFWVTIKSSLIPSLTGEQWEPGLTHGFDFPKSWVCHVLFFITWKNPKYIRIYKYKEDLKYGDNFKYEHKLKSTKPNQTYHANPMKPYLCKPKLTEPNLQKCTHQTKFTKSNTSNQNYQNG